ncbi:unnamed protein product [Gemmata massiliana]|uniref:Uncharacterized protein n=1 Tax=Gemmata massiliana TaxID=1210884 RepID=A0A6P2D800_9BACT|nr:hypothetical protein [Gemmata massiliana]VTR95590.1 unnamed protein product [Gemmata massiliana]
MIRRLAEWSRTPIGRRTITDLLVLAGVFGFVMTAHAPSLKHPPRADQWCYLVDTMNDYSFFDALRHSYSYNRTRQMMPGDTDLFRPVLFALLAAEKTAFEGNLALTQGFGIFLHCATCVLFLVLLRQIANIVRPPSEGPSTTDVGRDYLIYAALAFFALNPCGQELVIWSHLHGYLLFLLFLLGSVSCLFRYASGVQNGAPARGYLGGAWVLTLLSAFTYELGQFYAVLAGAFTAAVLLPQIGKKRAAVVVVAFASIMVVYQTTNRIDLRAHRGNYVADNLGPAIVDQAFTRATLEHSVRYGSYTAVQPFFPSLVQTTYSGQRLQIAESLDWKIRLRFLSPAVATSIAVFGAAAILGLVGLWRLVGTRARLPLLTLLLPTTLYAAYGAMTVLGRMNMRPTPYILSSNSYYAYTALLFGLLAASAAWFAVGSWGGRIRTGLVIGLLALSTLGAERIRDVNITVTQQEQELSRALRSVQTFVDAHRREPGFSFEIDYAASDPVVKIHNRRTTQIVFNEWMSAPQPRYRVVLRDGKVQTQPASVASAPAR